MRTLSKRSVVSRRSVVAGTLAAPLILSSREALALDKLRFGKSVPNSFAFSTAEVGTEAKIWEQENVELAVSAFRGDAQMQQALTAGAVDVAVGSGPGLGFRAKGVPAIGVAAMYGPPANLALCVLSRSPIRTVADLKDKRIGVTTLGSLTDWLVRKLSQQQGWGLAQATTNSGGTVNVAAMGGGPGYPADCSRSTRLTTTGSACAGCGYATDQAL